MAYTTLNAVRVALNELLSRVVLPTVEGIGQGFDLLDTTIARENSRGYVAVIDQDEREVGAGPCWRVATIRFAQQYVGNVEAAREAMCLDMVHLETIVDQLHDLLPLIDPTGVPSESVRPAEFTVQGVTVNRSSAPQTPHTAMAAVSFELAYHAEAVTISLREATP